MRFLSGVGLVSVDGDGLDCGVLLDRVHQVSQFALHGAGEHLPVEGGSQNERGLAAGQPQTEVGVCERGVGGLHFVVFRQIGDGAVEREAVGVQGVADDVQSGVAHGSGLDLDDDVAVV